MSILHGGVDEARLNAPIDQMFASLLKVGSHTAGSCNPWGSRFLPHGTVSWTVYTVSQHVSARSAALAMQDIGDVFNEIKYTLSE